MGLDSGTVSRCISKRGRGRQAQCGAQWVNLEHAAIGRVQLIRVCDVDITSEVDRDRLWCKQWRIDGWATRRRHGSTGLVIFTREDLRLAARREFDEQMAAKIGNVHVTECVCGCAVDRLEERVADRMSHAVSVGCLADGGSNGWVRAEKLTVSAGAG